MPLDTETIKSLEDVISTLIAEHMEVAFKELHARLQEGLRAVAKINMHYRGVWREENDYKRDEIMTHEGGVWLALRDSKGARPGDPEDPAWRLIVKRGERGSSPSIKIDIDGLLTAHYPDGATKEIGSIKHLVADLLVKHGAIPRNPLPPPNGDTGGVS